MLRAAVTSESVAGQFQAMVGQLLIGPIAALGDEQAIIDRAPGVRSGHRGTDQTKGIRPWPRQGMVTVPGLATGARAAHAGSRPACAFGDLPEPAGWLIHRRDGAAGSRQQGKERHQCQQQRGGSAAPKEPMGQS